MRVIPCRSRKICCLVIGAVNDAAEKDGFVLRLVADRLDVNPRDIIDSDLSLYDTTQACLLGTGGEFVTSGRLDDLSMVHAAASALLGAGEDCNQTRIMAIFDNENGSGTKQGAASPVLMNLCRRIIMALGGTEEDYLRGVAKSFMISADNAHGLHTNYPEKQDPTNHPVLGGGPVIKINANCKYMTDAQGAAVFSELCDRAGVRCQYFVNHADVAGGSTLGNISSSQFDIGVWTWAMPYGRCILREKQLALQTTSTQ